MPNQRQRHRDRHDGRGHRRLADVETPLGKIPAPGPDFSFPPHGSAPGSPGGPGIPNIPDIPGLDKVPVLGDSLSALDTINKAFELVVSAQFWLRVGEVILGAILIHMGLKNLSADYSSAGARVKKTAETAAAAAGAVAV